MPKRILVVEDDATIRDTLTFNLKKEGYAVTVAQDGADGVAKARSSRPDLILLDLHLPDIHGDQVLAALRSHPLTGQIPVVVLTADATAGQAERLRKAGAADCMTKPLDLARLLTIIDRYAGIGPEQN